MSIGWTADALGVFILKAKLNITMSVHKAESEQHDEEVSMKMRFKHMGI
jgi:hypothetical protein